ncbi:MAG: VCBS repeat-containing protein [Bacteroidota bacterium]
MRAFPGGTVYPVGLETRSVAVGDVDGDGSDDVVTVSRSSQDVSVLQPSVLLKHGDGRLAEPVSYPAYAYYPAMVTLGDLNKDGKPDLITIDRGNIAVFLNRGDGTFASPVNHAAGLAGEWVTAGDLNGDGYPDLVVTNAQAAVDTPPQNGAVAVLLNQGDATFGDPALYGVGISPSEATIADLNGDGRNDLAVTNSNDTSVSILLNEGQGLFAAPTAIAVGRHYFKAITNADLNGDGSPDLVLGGGRPDVLPGTFGVGVLLNLGGGRFDPLATYAPETEVQDIVAGDLNGDSKPDLGLVVNGFVGVSLNRGDGTLTDPVLYPAAGSSIGIGNLDSNGTLDLVASHVTVLLNQGGGDFGPRAVPVGTVPRSLATADLNADGFPDLATVDGTADLAVVLSDGNGGFAPTAHLATGPGSHFITAGDLNGDGKPDLAAVAAPEEGVVSILINRADGSFDAALPIPSAVHYDPNGGPQSVAINDLNGDGRGDLVVANNTTYGFASEGNISVLLNVGGTSFAPAVAYPALPDPGFTSWEDSDVSRLVVADLNGDGRPDLALAGTAIGVLLNHGDGTFSAAQHYGAGIGRALALAVGDVNKDGRPDLVATYLLDTFEEPLAVLLNDGTGTFVQSVPQAVAGATLLALGDLDKDGDLDLAMANPGYLTLLSNDGRGRFGVAGTRAIGLAPCLALQDFNGDTKIDIAAGGGTEVFLFLNRGF